MLEVAENRLLIVKQDGGRLNSFVRSARDALTGTRYLAPPIRSSVCQVKTGQGKSLIIASMATVLAVASEMPIDVACYSPYLSERDRKEFTFVIDAFGVADKICYGTINQLVETHGSGPLVRQLTRQLLTCSDGGGGLSASPAAADFDAGDASQADRILILDECDSVLKPDTYGANMCLDATLASPEAVELMTEMWKIKKAATGAAVPEASAFLDQVKQLPAHAALLVKYHQDAHAGLIEPQISRMVKSLVAFDPTVHKAEQPYVIQLNDDGLPAIAYKHGGK